MQEHGLVTDVDTILEAKRMRKIGIEEEKEKMKGIGMGVRIEER